MLICNPAVSTSRVHAAAACKCEEVGVFTFTVKITYIASVDSAGLSVLVAICCVSSRHNFKKKLYKCKGRI